MKVAPPNFGYVEDGIFRCGLPDARHYGFIASLRLKTCILLTDATSSIMTSRLPSYTSASSSSHTFHRWLLENGVHVIAPLSGRPAPMPVSSAGLPECVWPSSPGSAPVPGPAPGSSPSPSPSSGPSHRRASRVITSSGVLTTATTTTTTNEGIGGPPNDVLSAPPAPQVGSGATGPFHDSVNMNDGNSTNNNNTNTILTANMGSGGHNLGSLSMGSPISTTGIAPGAAATGRLPSLQACGGSTVSAVPADALGRASQVEGDGLLYHHHHPSHHTNSNNNSYAQGVTSSAWFSPPSMETGGGGGGGGGGDAWFLGGPPLTSGGGVPGMATGGPGSPASVCSTDVPYGPMTLSEPVVVRLLSVLLDATYYPLLITCPKGRYRTGVVCGCLRKMQRWNLVNILEEYRRFAGDKSRAENEEFIELFDTDLVRPIISKMSVPPAILYST